MGSSPYAVTRMAKRSRSPSPLNGVCVVFKCRDEEEIAISDDTLTLLREGGKVFAALLDGGGGFGASEDGTMIFQRFGIAASVVAKLVMAAKNTLEVETPNFEAVVDAAELVGGFSFVDALKNKRVKRPLDDVERRYEWRTVHYSYAGQILGIAEQGFEFASYEDNSKLYHFRKEIVPSGAAWKCGRQRGSIASSLGADRLK